MKVDADNRKTHIKRSRAFQSVQKEAKLTMPKGPSMSLTATMWKVTIVLALVSVRSTFSFPISPSVRTSLTQTAAPSLRHTSTVLRDSSEGNPPGREAKKDYTIADLRKELLQNPAKYQPDGPASKNKGRKTKAPKRSRKRVENPKQRYVYASQRQAIAVENKEVKKPRKSSETDDDLDEEEDYAVAVETTETDARSPLVQAKEFGLLAATQHTDPLVDEIEPVIVGQVRVGEEEAGSGSYAYLIEKPAGWSILGGSGASNANKKKAKATADVKEQVDPAEVEAKLHRKYTKQVKLENDDGSVDVVEYSELDVLALLTPEEIEEYKEEMGSIPTLSQKSSSDAKLLDDESTENKRVEDADTEHDTGKALIDAVPFKSEDLDPKTAANLARISARSAQVSEKASFATASRPSLVAWLKDYKAAEGTPIRGGKFWTAVAGAAGVDDSGLVLLCPKDKVDNVFVDYAEYIAVVGNGGYLAPRSKIKESALSKEKVEMDIVSKLRKGRGDDTVQTVRVTVPEGFSTCSTIVDPCQAQFQDGIRGDPGANPFDRRASRRLIHCNALSVSSLIQDESIRSQTPELPDDIAVLADRRNHLEFKGGSFLGRSDLQQNPNTTAYREINGDADGFPGWTVDRYDKWLLVQHDPKMPKGPLPSIHDGRTTGVYYLESNPDRSSMGAETAVRPRLLEGKPAPDTFPVLENGVTYLVSLDRDLSTGIFLDQRPQRAWLTRNCCSDTHVLNCFAHTGAFSVAAATAGASTVSLDLSKKWLDRLPHQLQSNGVTFDERHDCIYGDCFDWLTRLAKRGEKYDIVILDPPSSSVGGRKKKRWSVKNDMDELVALASTLVKKGGILWTTTNSASLHPIKFARLCRKGLEDAGIKSAKLERIQPMPADFPAIGSQPVKNFVWRIQ